MKKRDVFLKRMGDASLSLILFSISLPLWILIPFLIYLEDGFPIIFKKQCLGKNKKLFTLIKFRSMYKKYMYKDNGEINWKAPLELDYRITKVGRFLRDSALDELPQLWNILKGEMSFVGPRASRPIEIKAGDSGSISIWESRDFAERCRVRPGLTGVAQILLYRDTPVLEKIKYDIWYIKNQTLSLDLYLIFLSFLVTFRTRWEVKRNKFDFLANGLKKKIENQTE